MIYTIENLMTDPAIISAVINRLQVTLTNADAIDWRNYLTPKRANPDGTFKTYIGNQTGVVIGSFIDKMANKPIRKRHAMAKGYGEVAALGEQYQMDNARLEELQVLVQTYNERGEAAVVEEIVNFLVDDMRQVYLAPNKRMDLMLNDLKFKGTATVNANADQKGVKLQDVTIPLNKYTPAAGKQSTFISYIEETINALRAKGCDAAIAEMNRSTFRQYIVGCAEFKDTFVSKFGAFEYKPAGLATPDMANDLFQSLQIPLTIRLKNEYITMQNGVAVNSVPDKAISLLPAENIGNLRWKQPYEATDPVTGKTYTPSDNGMFIATQRTEEGRFIEYGAEWIVDIDKPNRMGLLVLDNFS